MPPAPDTDAKTSSNGTDTQKSGPRLSPRKIIIPFVLIAVGVIAYFQFAGRKAEDPTKLMVSGRIEGYETNIGPKIGGRVDFIAAREGESVDKGQLLVEISDDDIQAQLRGTEARIAKAQEQERQCVYQIEEIKSQIEQAEFDVLQSKEDAAARIEQAESNVAHAQAKLGEAEAAVVQAKSELELAKIRKERYAFLLQKGAVTTDESDQANTTESTNAALLKAKHASLVAARKELKRAEAALDQAKAARLNPRMKSAALIAHHKQLAQAQYQQKAALAEIKNAEAEREQVQANINYLAVKSPIDGIVTARSVEPGAVVVPGQTLLSLINLDTVYLRGYVPEGRIGQVYVGQHSNVFLDSFPDKPFDGEVIQIDPEGTFTPENIYFKDDRVKQVFGIKIAIKQPDRLAKPGMPADAQLDLTNAKPAQQ